MARRSRYAPSSRRAGSLFMPGTGGPSYRRRRRRVTGRRVLGGLMVVVLLAAAAGGVALWRRHADAVHARRAAATRFLRAWAHDDVDAMWRTLTPAARERHPRAAFAAAYRHATQAATQ